MLMFVAGFASAFVVSFVVFLVLIRWLVPPAVAVGSLMPSQEVLRPLADAACPDLRQPDMTRRPPHAGHCMPAAHRRDFVGR